MYLDDEKRVKTNSHHTIFKVVFDDENEMCFQIKVGRSGNPEKDYDVIKVRNMITFSVNLLSEEARSCIVH